jgi:hypothetical protein
MRASARAPLDHGLAALDDVLIMRLAGLQHEVPRVTVAKAARPYSLSLSS